ncbi:MAG: hypothetical protein QNJ90_14935 [Planctomycetota bacterium]|nr:hypothetical protein [Planctomycetota bacterium]
MTTRILAAILLITFAAPAFAHEVELNDGTKYEGKVLRQDENEVVIETTFDGMKTFKRADVKRVNTNVPPLREQLKYRAKTANDAKSRWDLYAWAKKKGFTEELVWILEAIVDLEPGDRKARKLLGHKKVDGRWMSPDEEKRYLKEKFEAEQRAKGLVEYEGEWVTPEERDAREKGLKKDGDEWVTEEEYHRRRGEKLVDGKWIKVGFKEGKELAGKALRESRVKLTYQWSPHFDAIAEIKPSLAKRVLDSSEKAFAVMRRTLRPTADDYPETIDERVKLALLKKLPGFVRFSQWFDRTYKADSLVPGFVKAITRQHSWWWVQDQRWTAAYQFPNTDKTFVSNVVHNVGLILITRYKANYAFPSVWLREGFAYYLEMEALGYTQSFTLGRGGSAGAGVKGPVWADSDKWRGALKKLVNEGQDPPLRRIARMTVDQTDYPKLVKSWSVVEFLVRYDAKRFKRFIDLSKDRSKKEEDALKEAYGWTYRKADAAWRAYVGANFTVQK